MRGDINHWHTFTWIPRELHWECSCGTIQTPMERAMDIGPGYVTGPFTDGPPVDLKLVQTTDALALLGLLKGVEELMEKLTKRARDSDSEEQRVKQRKILFAAASHIYAAHTDILELKALIQKDSS